MFDASRRNLLRGATAITVHSLFARNTLASEDGAAPSRVKSEALTPVGPRERLLLDFGWKFFAGDAADPLHDLGFGANLGDFAKTGSFEFATGQFDDSSWRPLNLPHDWAVELPFVRDETLKSHGYKPLGRKYPETSVGWYRRGFDIPASDFGRRIVLEFDGAYRNTHVFVNGSLVGRNDNGYTPFRFDITDFVRYGARNVLM